MPVPILDKFISAFGGQLIDGELVDVAQLENTIYVSKQGDDTFDGRSLTTPVQTFGQAITLAEGFSDGSAKIILCLDAGIYSEDIISSENNLVVSAPCAEVNALNLSGDNVGAIFNECTNITVGVDSFTEVRLVTGNITFETGAHLRTALDISETVSGRTIDFTGATGNIFVEIDNYAETVSSITIPSGLNLVGHLDTTLYGDLSTVLTALDITFDSTSAVGILNGAATVAQALLRIDAIGIGAPIFRFSGSYSAQNSNINEWFGGRQLVRMRCFDSGIGSGASGTVTFDLPGTTALTTAFDQLVAAGLPEVIRWVIEYTGDSKDRLSIRPRSSGSGPQITGTTSILVRSGVAAQLEITRTSGTISNYIFQDIGLVGDEGNLVIDTIKLINPATATWDASDGGPLPTTSVVKGNAYKVVNAPADGSGRFGEVMQDDDWVVWEGESFTSWASEPHLWFVLSAHDVRRITALERDFLTHIELSPVSDRNTVIRGADYADSAGEIRLKIYPAQSDYSAADLNTTGDIDDYVNTSDISGVLAVRLSGTRATLLSVLPTLYVYLEDSGGEFRELGNLFNDFSYQGDFGQESDYVSTFNVNYVVGDTIRIYIGSVVDRFNSPDLDINFGNLSNDLQVRINGASGDQNVNNQRITTLEQKVSTLYPLSPDVTDLTEWADIWNPERTAQEIEITSGHSLLADYRGDATRYESPGVVYDNTGTDVVTYTGLSESLHRSFGFKVSAPEDKILMWIVDGSERIPFVDMTLTDMTDGRFRINNYTPATTEDQHITNENHFLTRTAGDEIVTTASDSLSTFTITPFAANATDTSRSLSIGIEVFVDGVDTEAAGFVNIPLPSDNTAQDKQTVTHDENLGPLHGNRRVRTVVGYTLRVSGNDLLIDLTLEEAPSDVTVKFEDVGTLLNYTAPAAVARVDNWQVFNDGSGDYIFTGENELLFTFQPHQFDEALEAVGGAIGATGSATLFNDIRVPRPAHEFSSVEIPDDIEFRTFVSTGFLIHNDVGHLLTRRATQWVYGLALLRAVTEHAVTTAIDFTDGLVLTSPNSTRYKLTVDNTGALKTEVIT